MGGFSGSDEWIVLAESLGIDWWITSALESNIGLNADLPVHLHQEKSVTSRIGNRCTFTNNFETHLQLEGDQMWHKK